tara:strand:+ start:141 stop:395 length:255 start_codon:yes stop_codon:yes gene_type:complete
MVSNIIEEIRCSKTAIALFFALLSLVYTYIEVRSSNERKRTIIGIYLRNFTFSFIIVYSALYLYKSKITKTVKTQAILTGRPNF